MSDFDEIWKVIDGATDYAVSNEGRVKRLVSRTSAKAGQILKQCLRNGYLCVSLPIGGKWSNHNVHRLVAAAFLDKPTGEYVVNHLNGDRKDNRLENLEWVTQSQNVQHSYANRLQSSDQNRGANNGQAKLSESQVREIRSCSDRESGYKQRLATIYHISPNYVSEIIRGKVWRHIL